MTISDPIYSIQDTDPLGGGDNSVDNLPHKQLNEKIHILNADISNRPTREELAEAIKDFIRDSEFGAVTEVVGGFESDILERARVFYTQPVGPYAIGDLWIDDGVLYQSTQDRADGEFVSGDWVWCIRSNVTCLLESINGDVFRPGQCETTMIAHCFKNAIEITADLLPTQFNWRRVSADTAGDAVWNVSHQGLGYTILLTAVDVVGRATIFVDIVE